MLIIFEVDPPVPKSAEVLLSIIPDDGFKGKFVQTARMKKNDGR